ncbi:hypothetical protein [Streptomyces tsukubensis]|uniref:Uncharacterized protein n=1 Tax=Streptomyces tsukubensis TaxID=83656 RepID=A0A1V4AAC3_9ACTN|nr:hypothetical protein [Streptomyces tsukubensis]OON80069.1 hypothetical protein B1H18_12900 [Streptomyces tsukubensis]QFR97301.1 hypothetical protein GBW32_34865 [Streptomyces tsukubensis]
MSTQSGQENGTKRPISISAVVDCVGALASRSMEGNLYLYDTNKAGGSTGFGTEELKTRVREGDQLVWSVLALECEAYVAIDGIVIDSAICEPERKVYPGTDVVYWTGTVKQSTEEPVPYQLQFNVGTRGTPITTTVSPVLFDRSPRQSASARQEEER